jgi:hypothetical protein
MHASGAPSFDVGAFLERVESLAPIEAVEAVADALAEWVDARRMTFLIADFSGRAVVRLSSSGPVREGARNNAGNAATLDVAAALAATADLHPREVVHELGAAVLRATGGDLHDDATMVCLNWYGGPLRRRQSEYGADRSLASAERPPGTGRS